jgi:ubiquinone biosynthesis protein COQ4
MASCMRNLSRYTQRTFSSPASRAFLPRLTLGFFQNAGYARSINTTPAYEGHIPLNWFENAFLAAGSAVMSLVDPRRGGTEFDL